MEKSEMMEQIRKIETALSVELPEVVVRYLLQREIICEYLDYLDSADDEIGRGGDDGVFRRCRGYESRKF